MKNRLSLKDVEWGEFQVSDIFNSINRGKRLTKSNQKLGDTPYISSSALDNGVDNFISNDKNVRKFYNVITIANSGSVGKVFYHPYTFVASDHVTSLKNMELSYYQYLFVASTLERISEKYSFNREINNERIKREKILLPVRDNQPHWQFIEDYMKQVESDLLEQEIAYFKTKLQDVPEVKPLDEVDWGEFFIEEIAKIHPGKDIYGQERILGNFPYITSTAQNNGVGYYVSNKNNTLGKNYVSVNRNGSVGYAFFHGYNALFSNDVRKLFINNGEKYL